MQCDKLPIMIFRCLFLSAALKNQPHLPGREERNLSERNKGNFMGNGHFSVFYILFCVAVTSVYTVFRTQHTKYLCFLSLIPLFKKAPTLLYILLKKVIPSAIV